MSQVMGQNLGTTNDKTRSFHGLTLRGFSFPLPFRNDISTIKAESLGLRSDIGSFAGSPNESNHATNAEGTAVRSHLHSTRRGSPGCLPPAAEGLERALSRLSQLWRSAVALPRLSPVRKRRPVHPPSKQPPGSAATQTRRMNDVLSKQ